MVLSLEELDAVTRAHMEQEFLAERNENPYLSERLTAYGAEVWPQMMLDAIRGGDDDTLIYALRSVPGVLMQRESFRTRRGELRSRVINPYQASELLAVGEFGTWYVRGLAARLLAEGVEEVEVYRAAPPRWAIGACARHEGLRVATQTVYDGHRAGYWPVENPNAFSVPFGPGCHHSIRRPSTNERPSPAVEVDGPEGSDGDRLSP